MSLTHKDVQHLAKLARLSLSEKELETYRVQLSGVLEYVEQLKKLKTDDVTPTSQVTGLTNNFRTDEVRDCPEDVRRDIISQFPDHDGDLLRVPPVFNQK